MPSKRRMKISCRKAAKSQKVSKIGLVISTCPVGVVMSLGLVEARPSSGLSLKLVKGVDEISSFGPNVFTHWTISAEPIRMIPGWQNGAKRVRLPLPRTSV